MPGSQALLWGAVGAAALAAVEFFRVVARPKKVRRRQLNDPWWWSTHVVSIAIGGGFAAAYTQIPDIQANSWIALTVGAAWPTILGRAQDAAPLPSVKTGEG